MATAKATQKTSEEDLNKINTTLKSQPWYQQFFKDRGIDPTRVKLSGTQRQALTGIAAQNGYALGDRMKFDEAGNMNQSGGFAGMPTWAKIAIAAAPVVATAGFGAAGMGPMAGMMGAGGGGGAALGGSAATGLTSGMAGAAPSIAGATTLAGGASLAGGGAAAAASAPSLMSRIASMGKNPLISGAGRMISQAGQASATNRGVQMDATMEHDRLQLDADRDRRNAETDAMRKSLYGQIAAGYQPSTRPNGVSSRNPVGGFVTDQARQAGQSMTDTAMARMRDQNYGVGITPMSALPMKPGLMERIAGYAGPAMSLFDPRLYDENGQPHAR